MDRIQYVHIQIVAYYSYQMCAYYLNILSTTVFTELSIYCTYWDAFEGRFI